MTPRFGESSGAPRDDEDPRGVPVAAQQRFVQAQAGRAHSFAEVMRTAFEELIDLLTAQMKLARAELSADISRRVHRAVRVAVFVPAALGGYLFAMAALAYWLADMWGRPLAFLIVAALQATAGGIGMICTLRDSRSRPLLEHAKAEAAATLHETIAAVSATNDGAKGVPLDA